MAEIRELSVIRRWMKQAAARRDWESENPELAKAWSEALEEDHEWQLRRERAERVAKAKADAPYALHRLGVPRLALDALAKPDDTEPYQVAQEFLAGDQRFLLLGGRVGVGKTVAGASVLLEAWVQHRVSGRLSRYEPIAFERAATLSRLPSFGPERGVYEHLCEASAVLLDDVGIENRNPYAKTLFDEWFDRRDEPGRRTVFTTNLNRQQFREQYGERIWDRIRASCLAMWFDGKSLRGKP